MTEITALQARLIGVRTLAAQYGISKSTIYELINSDPNFPYKNFGKKKKFMIDALKFEKWLDERTERQKDEHFCLPSARTLSEKYRR